MALATTIRIKFEPMWLILKPITYSKALQLRLKTWKYVREQRSSYYDLLKFKGFFQINKIPVWKRRCKKRPSQSFITQKIRSYPLLIDLYCKKITNRKMFKPRISPFTAVNNNTMSKFLYYWYLKAVNYTQKIMCLE